MNPRPEMIADVEPSDGGDDGAERNEMGLTAEEQAAFDGMKNDAPPADDGKDDAAGDDAEGDDASDGNDTGDDADPAPLTLKEGEKPPADRQQPKTVNYSKYRREVEKERKRAEATAAELQTERLNQARLTERLNIINQAIAASQQAAQAAPQGEQQQQVHPFDEPDIDPREDYAGAIDQLARRQRAQREEASGFQQQTQAEREDVQLRDNFQRDAQVFSAKEPAFMQAYQFLKDSRLIELAISQFDKDPRDPNANFTPQELNALIHNFNEEEKWVVKNAQKSNKSPAEAIFKLARARGFAPAAPEAPKPAARAPAASPDARVAPAAARPVAPNVVAELEALRQARDAGVSLSDGGGSPGNGLTAETLLQMSDGEFEQYMDTLPQHKIDALMGR